jgi:peptidoglycan/xylan/chitin deacetylase (PgdA/CDA1 family)
MSLFETSICRWKNDAKAALTLSFDGCYTITYELALEALLRYKMPATWFIVTNYVGDSLQGRKVATWQDWKSASQLGMEIASHTVTHPHLGISPFKAGLKLIRSILKKGWTVLMKTNKITKAKNAAFACIQERHGVSHSLIIDEAIQSKNTIEAQIPFQRALSFAYPGGRYNSALKKGIREAGYLSARATEDGYNYLSSIAFYALKSKVWNINVNAEMANEWIDFALGKGAWLIETYHVVSPDAKSGYHYDTAISDFEAHLAYISSQNICVDTQQNIAKYIAERNATEINLNVFSDERVVLIVKNSLDFEIYNQTLTLKTLVPFTWSRIRIAQAEKVQKVLPVEENGKHYIYYNILPNKEEVVLTPTPGGKHEI